MDKFRKFPKIFAAEGASLHRCPWHHTKNEKICNHKSFSTYFVWTPFDRIVNIWIIFFRSSIIDTGGTGGKIYCRCRWYRWQICHWCPWYRWWTLTCEYLHKCLKNFEMTLMLFSRAWWKMIHEKNMKEKNLMTLALLDDSNKLCGASSYIFSLQNWSWGQLRGRGSWAFF